MTRYITNYRMKPDKVARGQVEARRRRHRQIVCAFDHDTFEQIRKRAVEAETSFAEQVRVLCEWGLEAERKE